MDTAAFGSPSAVTPYMYAPSRAHSETHGPRATSTARKLSSCVLIEMPHATDLATEHGTRFGIPRMTCDLYTKVTRVTAHTRRDLTGSGTVSIHSRRMRKTVSTVQLVSPRDALFASLAFIRSNIAPNLRRASSSRLDPTSSSHERVAPRSGTRTGSCASCWSVPTGIWLSQYMAYRSHPDSRD
jgi:hypothetical protein